MIVEKRDDLSLPSFENKTFKWPAPHTLLKEARETWGHFVTDKLVQLHGVGMEGDERELHAISRNLSPSTKKPPP